MSAICFNQENPKKSGSGAYARYELFKAATTWAEFNDLGGTRGDKKNCLDKGFVENQLTENSHTDDAEISETETETETEIKVEVETPVETEIKVEVEQEPPCVSCYPKSAGTYLCEDCNGPGGLALTQFTDGFHMPPGMVLSTLEIEDAIRAAYSNGHDDGYKVALKHANLKADCIKAGITGTGVKTSTDTVIAKLVKAKPVKAKPVNKVAQKKPSQATGKKAAKKPNTICEFTGATINNISSFKFTLKDTEKSKYIISFNSKDGLTTTEYCPAHIVETNDDTADFLVGNATYSNTGTYSNSTKRIPGSFKFKKTDFVEYPVGTRTEFWKGRGVERLETWVGKK